MSTENPKKTDHLREPDYEALEALIRSVSFVEKDVLAVDFGCPETDFNVTARVRLEGEPPESTDHDDPRIRAAVLEAFHQVSFHYLWDEVEERYISVGAARRLPSNFARLVAAHELDEDDEEVLAHILARVGFADEGPTVIEREFYEAFTSRVSTPMEILADDPMSAEEVDSLSTETSEVILMIAWAMACTEGKCKLQASRRVQRFRDILGVPAGRSDQLARYAREYLVDQRLEGLYAVGRPSAEQRMKLSRFGEQLGFNADEVRAAEARFVERRGDDLPDPSDADGRTQTPVLETRRGSKFQARHNPKVREPHTEAPRSPGVFGSGGASPLER